MNFSFRKSPHQPASLNWAESFAVAYATYVVITTLGLAIKSNTWTVSLQLLIGLTTISIITLLVFLATRQRKRWAYWLAIGLLMGPLIKLARYGLNTSYASVYWQQLATTVLPSTAVVLMLMPTSYRWVHAQQLLSKRQRTAAQEYFAKRFSTEAPKTTISLEEYLKKWGALPLPDRSNSPRNFLMSAGQVDLGYAVLKIELGGRRPVWVECWADEGHITNATFFMSRIGIEDVTTEQITAALISQGYLRKAKHATSIPSALLRLSDRQDHPVWSLTLTLAVRDEYYCKDLFGLHKYVQIDTPLGRHSYTVCMVCGEPRVEPIAYFSGRGVPHTHKSHDFVYDYKALTRCRSCASGQIEIYSHDCWSHDEMRDMYWWYVLSAEDLSALLEMNKPLCDTPFKYDCECHWHTFWAKLFNTTQLTDRVEPVSKAYQAKQYVRLSLNSSPQDTLLKSTGSHDVIKRA